MTAKLIISEHDQLGGLGDDDHAQYLLITGVRPMTGNLDMGDNNILNVGNIYGGDAATDNLDLYPNSVSPPATWSLTENLINVWGRVNVQGFTDLSVGSGVPSPSYSLIRHDEVCDCSGQGGIIPQGFWNTPIFQYDTQQTFGGSSTFQDSQVWEETAVIGPAHGFFTLGSFLAGLRYKCDHAVPGVGNPPSELFGISAQPGVDQGNATSLTVDSIIAIETNAVFGLKAFLGLEELRGGVTVTTYRHFAANSNIADGLLLQGGSTIGTEIGLDLRNINHGTTKISIRSDQPAAYMLHAGEIRINSDANGLVLGAGLDALLYYDGTDLALDCSLVAPSDFHIDCGTDKTVVLDETVWEDLRIVPGAFEFAGVSDPTLSDWQPGGSGATFKIWKFQENDEVFFTCQLPHSYKEGTDIKAHLHWTPADRGNEENGNDVDWRLDYSWANQDGTFPSSATVAMLDTCDGADDKHQMTTTVTISGTGKTVSSMVVCRLYRDPTNDTWVGITAVQSPGILEFDFHHEVDTLGSRQELVK